MYTVQTRATDYVGNQETPGSGTSFIVDNTAPGADFGSLSDGQALTFDRRSIRSKVIIAGTANDLLSGASQVAGLEVVQLSIDRGPWINVVDYPSSPHPTTANWSYSWDVNKSAYGSHSLRVRAVDALSQIGAPAEISIIIDTLDPTNMWSNFQPFIPAGQSYSLLGHADDIGNVPLLARPYALENFMDSIISSTVMLMPEAFTDTVGMNVSWLGDVNGDARADLAVGMPSAAVDGQQAGGG